MKTIAVIVLFTICITVNYAQVLPSDFIPEYAKQEALIQNIKILYSNLFSRSFSEFIYRFFYGTLGRANLEYSVTQKKGVNCLQIHGLHTGGMVLMAASGMMRLPTLSQKKMKMKLIIKLMKEENVKYLQKLKT